MKSVTHEARGEAVLTSLAAVHDERYLPAIDGLRAIAVVAVVLFHAGVPGMPGGFVGVDVFFVISGYLITGLLARELATSGGIDILNFYARRVRRLLPAFTLVLIATLAAGAIVLSPIGEQQELAKSALATTLFASNVYFWRTQTGYFAGPSDQLPLLHTWTLAVEEQFYIIWPLAMLAIGYMARRFNVALRPALLIGLLAGTLVSLLASIAVTPVKTTLAFYLLPFRAWELGIGALLALVLSASNGAAFRLASWLAPAGLSAILVSVAAFGQYTPFPGYAALLPVLGSAAVVAGIVLAPLAPVTRLLATAPMTAIGKLSYSWYLWHWPLLALARADALGAQSLPRDLALVTFALLLSALTYRFVEQPIRKLRPWPFTTGRTAVAAGSVLMAVMAASAFVLTNFSDHQLAKDPIAKASQLARTEKFALPAHCSQFEFPFRQLTPIDGCVLGAGHGRPEIVLWGDSNAFHFAPTFAPHATSSSHGVLPRAMGACMPQRRHVSDALDPTTRRSAESCVAFNAAMKDQLPALKAAGARVVALAARWSMPSYGHASARDWADDLDVLVAHIRKQGLDVLIIADVPGYEHLVPECIVRRGPDACARPRSEVDAERAASAAALRAIAAGSDRVTIWDPIEHVCDARTCRSIRDGVVMQSDKQHLSVEAARRLAPALAAHVAEFLQ